MKFIVDTVVDVCSSGTDVTDDWHKETLQKIFKTVPVHQRKELLNEILIRANSSEGWTLLELQMIADLLYPKESPKIVFRTAR